MVKYYSGTQEIHDDGIENPVWVYHPSQGSKVVDSNEVGGLLVTGWFNSPDFTPTPAAEPSPADSFPEPEVGDGEQSSVEEPTPEEAPAEEKPTKKPAKKKAA